MVFWQPGGSYAHPAPLALEERSACGSSIGEMTPSQIILLASIGLKGVEPETAKHALLLRLLVAELEGPNLGTM